MNESKCQRCGAPLDANAGDVFCPACLLQSTLDLPETDLEMLSLAPLPRMFGPYRLLEEIGRGGMGVVYRAEQAGLGRTVAVKLLLGGAHSTEAALRRFHLEAATAAGLQHPNIVAIHDYGEVDGQPYYGMDLILGRNLAEQCGGRPLPARRAAELLRLLAAAVHYAHQQGVVHRDLKPSNVLIDAEGRPRITDFGLAKRIDAATGGTLTGQMLGSPSYVAPEQAAAHAAQIGVASDVYGLGALLYHLLTGRAPFNAATPTETLRLVLETEPPAPRLLNPSLPRDLETICLTCLEKEPARRYASAAAVVEDLECHLNDRPIRARPPSALHRMRKFVRRHRVSVTAAAAVVVALVGGLTFAMLGFRRAVVQERIAVAQQQAADAARAQAEHLVGLMTNDLRPALGQRGGLPQLLKLTEETVGYYEQLPPALRCPETDAQHAAALEELAQLRGNSFDDRKGAEAAQRAALRLREAIARLNPDDPDAAAALLRNEWRLAWVTGDAETQRSEARQKEFERRWQQLYARFPDQVRVRQGLAEFLSEYAQFAASVWYKPEEALAAAKQSRALVDALAAVPPPDRAWSNLVERSYQALTSAYNAAGESGEAIVVGEQNLAYCTRLLQGDPGNVALRWQAAEAARTLSYHLFATSGVLSRDAERIAREHYRILTELDPDEQQYRFCHALAHAMECSFLEIDGNLPNARRAFDEYYGLLKPFATWKGDVSTVLGLIDNRYLAADFAAAAGDVPAARAHLAEAETQIEAWRARPGPNPREQRRVRILSAPRAAWALWRLRDWPELNRLTQASLEEIERGLREQPDDPELRLLEVVMQGFQALVLHGTGHPGEAAVALQAVLTRLKTAKPVPNVHPDHMSSTATTILLVALAQSGQAAEARRLGEQALQTPAWFFGWSAAEFAAQAATIVAGLLEPAEILQRIALLDQAADLLTSPQAEGRRTVQDCECLAEIGKRQAAAILPDAAELAAAGHRLDESAANDPDAAERILRQAEVTWHSDAWTSAASSPRACAAQREIRERLAALMAQEPESAGLRFLHAMTYRMECYVHLGVDGLVEPARAAFADYDARLAPFANRQGYACVRRTRVENALRLAQLAASVGDTAGARTWREEAGRRHAANCERPELGVVDRRLARVRFLEESAWIAWWLRDWTDLERLAQEARTEADTALQEQPAHAELLTRRAMAMGFGGLAMSGAGRCNEAIAQFAAAARASGDARGFEEVWDSGTLTRLMWIARRVSLARAGELHKARFGADDLLAPLDSCAPFYLKPWFMQKYRATFTLMVAGLLDPAIPGAAARRQKLLDDAAAFLAPDKIAGRATVDVQELLAELGRLRANPGESAGR